MGKQPEGTSRKEAERIVKAYSKRDRKGKKKLYSPFRVDALFMRHQKERNLLELLKAQGMTDLEKSKILDVGCGTGGMLRDFIRYGANPENCFGIDLLPDRIETARHLSPNMTFVCGNAEQLPFGDNQFDIVICYLVFSSVLDRKMKARLVREMTRVLKEDGAIIWYDFFYNNPTNPDVRGVTRKEIASLFPECTVLLRRVTLAPPITRTLSHFSLLTCYLLEKLKVFNTHYMGIIRKKGSL